MNEAFSQHVMSTLESCGALAQAHARLRGALVRQLKGGQAAPAKVIDPIMAAFIVNALETHDLRESLAVVSSECAAMDPSTAARLCAKVCPPALGRA